jgi:hypothetical protein
VLDLVPFTDIALAPFFLFPARPVAFFSERQADHPGAIAEALVLGIAEVVEGSALKVR